MSFLLLGGVLGCHTGWRSTGGGSGDGGLPAEM